MEENTLVTPSKKYDFQTDEFGLSNDNLHWLRSGYNYKTIPYQRFDKFWLTRGREVNNWWLLFGFGIVMLGLMALIAVSIYYDLTDNPYITTINIDKIVALVIPFFLGVFSLYMSLRNSEMLYVYQGRKRHRFPLRKLVREGRGEEFVRYLKSHPDIRTKLRIDESLKG